jgi:hypothetical protein
LGGGGGGAAGRGALGGRGLGLERAGGGDQFGGVEVDEPGGRLAGRGLAPFEHGAQQGEVGLHPGQAELGQGAVGAQDRLGQGRAAADHLGQQGIVIRAGDVAGVAVAVDPHPRPRRRLVGLQASAAGNHLALGGQGLQIDARLDREAARRRRGGEADILQGFAGGQADLGLDEIDAGDLLGDRVLDLQAGVGLDEGEVAALGVEQELDGPQGLVAHRRGDAHRRLEEALAQVVGKAGGGGDLDDLLVAALQGAVALADRQDPGAVAGHLDLDVAGPLDQALGVEAGLAERGQGLAAGGGVGLGDLAGLAHHPQAAPAAPGHGLDDHRRPLRQGGEEGLDLGHAGRAADPVDHRRAVLGGDGPGPGLVAQGVQRLRRGADEGQAGAMAGAGEGGALREESVARMDRVAAAAPGRRHHRLDVEIGPRPGPGQRAGAVGGADVAGGGVVLGEDGGGGDPQLAGGPGDADGDLAAVGDQDVADRHAIPLAAKSP